MSTISASTTSTTAFKITTDTTGALVFQTGSSPTTAVTFDASQNVGIGVSSPLRKLDVRGASSTFGNAFLVDTTSGTTGTGGGVIFGSDDGLGSTLSYAAVQGIKENSTAGNTQGALLFVTKSSGGTQTERARIASNGILAMNGATVQSWATFTSGGIIQFANGNYITGLQANSTQIGSNGYYNGSNWVYQANGPGANINVDTSGSAGTIYLRTAPTSTAGANQSSAWVYNLTAFSNSTVSINNAAQNGYTFYVEGQHTSGYGGVYFNSADTAYYCSRSATAAGQGLRMLNSSNAEIARVSIEPGSSDFQFLVGSDYPIKFYTNSVHRWTIDNSATSGNLIAASANVGIKFNRSGALNNQVLNDYEYGTWTPTIGAVGGSNFTMTEQNGIYVKVGQMVTVVGIVSWSSKGSASSSAGIYIKNLPFLSNSDGTNTRTVGTWGIMPGTTTNWYNLWLYGGGNDTNIQISGKNSLTGGSVDLTVADIASSAATRFSITYVAN